MKWRHTEWHINLLEAQANLIMLRWRLRRKQGVRTRFVHLLDSQVCTGVFGRHWSTTQMMNRIVRRASARELAGFLMPIYVYVRSENNPADKPSRTASARRQVKKVKKNAAKE